MEHASWLAPRSFRLLVEVAREGIIPKEFLGEEFRETSGLFAECFHWVSWDVYLLVVARSAGEVIVLMVNDWNRQQ